MKTSSFILYVMDELRNTMNEIIDADYDTASECFKMLEEADKIQKAIDALAEIDLPF